MHVGQWETVDAVDLRQFMVSERHHPAEVSTTTAPTWRTERWVISVDW